MLELSIVAVPASLNCIPLYVSASLFAISNSTPSAVVVPIAEPLAPNSSPLTAYLPAFNVKLISAGATISAPLFRLKLSLLEFIPTLVSSAVAVIVVSPAVNFCPFANVISAPETAVKSSASIPALLKVATLSSLKFCAKVTPSASAMLKSCAPSLITFTGTVAANLTVLSLSSSSPLATTSLNRMPGTTVTLPALSTVTVNSS